MHLNQQQQAKVSRFLSDVELESTIKAVLLDTFMKEQGGDVHQKAAQMMAINLLNEAWRDMERHKLRMNASAIKTGPISL